MELFNRAHRAVPSNAVNIMRPGPWGNPFSEREFGREQCIKLYEHWLFLNPQYVAFMRRELRHKDLVCCCWPKPCHGNVILRVVDKGEEPQPLDVSDPTLVRYQAKFGDRLAPAVTAMVNAFSLGERPRDTLPYVQMAWDKLKPHLERLLRNSYEGWPSAPSDCVQVTRHDLVAWRSEWLETQKQIAEQDPDVDQVTPFDHYLYGKKPS